MTGDEFYQNDNTFQFKHMFQQKLVSSSGIQYKAMEVEISTDYKFIFKKSVYFVLFVHLTI